MMRVFFGIPHNFSVDTFEPHNYLIIIANQRTDVANTRDSSAFVHQRALRINGARVADADDDDDDDGDDMNIMVSTQTISG